MYAVVLHADVPKCEQMGICTLLSWRSVLAWMSEHECVPLPLVNRLQAEAFAVSYQQLPLQHHGSSSSSSKSLSNSTPSNSHADTSAMNGTGGDRSSSMPARFGSKVPRWLSPVVDETSPAAADAPGGAAVQQQHSDELLQWKTSTSAPAIGAAAAAAVAAAAAAVVAVAAEAEAAGGGRRAGRFEAGPAARRLMAPDGCYSLSGADVQ
jgi:hypothetical protein